jgi:hypothetical protein
LGKDGPVSDERFPQIPFRPKPRDWEGYPMPSSVPPGLRLELSRARIVDGKEDEFEEWMSALNSRYEEMQEGLAAERQVFEATFRSTEADGSTWIYHLSLMGVDGGGNDESIPIDALHAQYSRSVKHPGWEELEPKLMLTPDHLRDAMVSWARSGSTDA